MPMLIIAFIVAAGMAILSIPGVSSSVGLRSNIDSLFPFCIWAAVALVIVLVHRFTPTS
jgi:hypothetical protein